MKLSIIVPVFNMAKDNKLSFCLDSLVNQTIEDYEIIAVDDASTDDSLSVLYSYRDKYPELIKVVESKVNAHQGGAKNKGLKAATGEWIGFIDSDDWISPDMYEKLIKKAEATGADLVGCDYSLVNEHTYEIGTIVANSRDDQVGQIYEASMKSFILDGGSLCVKIYRKERIDRLGLRFPENIFYEDNAVGNTFLVTAGKFAYVKEPLYYYYQHQSSTVHTVSLERCRDRMKASEIMIDEAQKYGYFDMCKDELEYKFIMLYLTNTLFSYMRGVRFPKVNFVKSLVVNTRARFPKFDENPYYTLRIPREEKRFVRLTEKNAFLSVLLYKALWLYRGFRK